MFFLFCKEVDYNGLLTIDLIFTGDFMAEKYYIFTQTKLEATTVTQFGLG